MMHICHKAATGRAGWPEGGRGIPALPIDRLSGAAAAVNEERVTIDYKAQGTGT